MRRRRINRGLAAILCLALFAGCSASPANDSAPRAGSISGGTSQPTGTAASGGNQAGSRPASPVSPSGPADASVVGWIDGQPLTQEELAFQELLNRIQIAIHREADLQTLSGEEKKRAMAYWDQREAGAREKNSLLTQLIRVRAMALLAREKGHAAAPEEVAKELAAAKTGFARHPAAQEMIRAYGEERFWQQERSWLEQVVLSKKVRNDLLEQVKQANPKATAREWNALADNMYEDLLVSQVGTLSIKLAR